MGCGATMSINAIYSVWCDSDPTCGVWFGQDPSVFDVKRQAEAAGWKVCGYRAFCPKHADQQQADIVAVPYSGMSEPKWTAQVYSASELRICFLVKAPPKHGHSYEVFADFTRKSSSDRAFKSKVTGEGAAPMRDICKRLWGIK